MIAADRFVSVESVIADFERAVRRDATTDLADFLPTGDHPDYAELLVELVRVDMELAWSTGRPRRVGDYLARFPDLDSDVARRELCFEEDRLRRIADDAMSSAAADYRDGSPSTAEARATAKQDAAHRLFSELHARDVRSTRDLAEALTRFPNVGDRVLGFELVAELGRGAFSRVYLARERDVADRLVALKLTGDARTEVAALARLRHTNIAPVLSVRRERPIEAVCMPYLGGTTLRHVIARLGDEPRRPTSGRWLVSCVREPEKTAPLLARLGELTYVNAALELAVRMAAGLAHAHERGICHRDLKPANVLFANDGEPLLLDFNLSEDDGPAGLVSGAIVGGTLPYMAPEQLRNFSGVGQEIDARADVYSFGLVLFELLTGQLPTPVPSGNPDLVLLGLIELRRDRPASVRKLNPGVSPAFAAIVAKCLEPEATHRYPSAKELLDDLTRQQQSLPLRHAPEPSLCERLTKWARRHPRLSSGGGVTAVALAVLTAVGLFAWRIDRDRAELSRRTEARLFQDELRSVRFALASPEPAPEALERGLAVARRAWDRVPTAGDVPTADRFRLAYLSERSERLAERRATDRAEQQRRRDAAAAWKERARSLHSGEAFDADDEIAALELSTSGRHAEACAKLAGVTERKPDSVTAWHARGIVEQAAGRHADAAASFTTALALDPASADSYHARAIARRTLRRFDEALADLNRVPDSPALRFDRGLVLFDLGKFAEADADVTAAIDAGFPETRAYFFRARIRQKLGNAVGADADRREGLTRTPASENDWLARIAARLPGDAKTALTDCERCIERFPNSARAWQAKAHIFGEMQGRPADGRRAMDEAVRLSPEDALAYAGRGVFAARAGDFAAARADAEKALTLNDRAEVVYQVAGILALTAQERPADRDRALFLLQRAIHHDFGADLVGGDPELKSLRDLPEVRRLLELASPKKPS